MRTRFETDQNKEDTTVALNKELSRFTPQLKIRTTNEKPKVLLMITKESHCLRDLIYLFELGELKVDIPLIVSNHLGEFLKYFLTIPFCYFYISMAPPFCSYFHT